MLSGFVIEANTSRSNPRTIRLQSEDKNYRDYEKRQVQNN